MFLKYLIHYNESPYYQAEQMTVTLKMNIVMFNEFKNWMKAKKKKKPIEDL